MAKKSAPVENQEPRSQVPFGLEDTSYILTKPKPYHRVWTHMQGKEEHRDQVVDLGGLMIMSAHDARKMPHFPAIFQRYTPEEEAVEDGQAELKGAESPKKYVARLIKKMVLGKDCGYHSDHHKLVITDGLGEDVEIDPKQGITLKEILRYSDENGTDKVLANVMFKHIPWDDAFLECMDYEFTLHFKANDRPIQSTIAEIDGDDDDQGDEE